MGKKIENAAVLAVFTVEEADLKKKLGSEVYSEFLKGLSELTQEKTGCRHDRLVFEVKVSAELV